MVARRPAVARPRGAPSAGESGAEQRLVEGVHRIAVLRPNAVGDFVFALPALEALRAAYPEARITYLGRPWHVDFLRDRPGPVDEALALPAVRGVGAAPTTEEDSSAVEMFLCGMRERRFDLAFQLYGGGRHANPFVKSLGARLTLGSCTPDALPLDRWMSYRPLQNERLRLLDAVALAGARPVTLDPRLAVTAADEKALHAQIALPNAPLIVLQPGATDPRRRWPPERFARVADALASEGARIAINGTRGEAGIVAAVRAAMRHEAFDLSGKLSLGGLLGLLARAALVVSNDTGPLHLAQAVGTPTLGLYWFTNLLVSQPLASPAHDYFMSTQLNCPVCGVDNVASRCPHDVSFISDIAVEPVMETALAAFERSCDGRRAASAPRAGPR